MRKQTVYTFQLIPGTRLTHHVCVIVNDWDFYAVRCRVQDQELFLMSQLKNNKTIFNSLSELIKSPGPAHYAMNSQTINIRRSFYGKSITS